VLPFSHVDTDAFFQFPGVGAAPTPSSFLMRQLEKDELSLHQKDKTVLPRKL